MHILLERPAKAGHAAGSSGLESKFPDSVVRAWKYPAGWLRNVLGMLAICALVLAVYRPLLPGMFLMDDHRLVAEDNPLVNGEFTWRNIWFQTDFILSDLVFWAQWLAWGNGPAGYHAVNMGLHATGAILLWRVLLQMKIPGAWLAGLIYAVHPVAVTSVARIAELKNTLSLPFFLFSLWAYLRSEPAESVLETPDRSRQPWRRTAWYGVALGAFVLALLSKTSTVTLPVVLLLCIWWRRRVVAGTDVRRLAPFFLVAVVFGVMSAWFQKYQALGGVPLPSQSFWERLAVAGNILWFYLGKVLVPTGLNAFYPVWKVNPLSPLAYIPVLLAVAGFVLCWRFRERWGRPLLFGLGCFAVTLFPVLGFFDAQYLTWFQVSDHLQYLPMIAPVALVAALLAGRLGARTYGGVGVCLVAGLALLAFQRARVFSDEETLMRDCVAKNPAAWGAQAALGTILAKRQDYAGAITNFEAGLRYQPADPLVQLNLAHALALEGKFAEAEPHFLLAVKTHPADPEMHRQYAPALERQGRTREALMQWRMAISLKPDAPTRARYAALLFKSGDARQAEVQLRLVLAQSPEMPDALNNLAWLLATSAREDLRNGAEAVRYSEKACALTHYRQVGMVGTLAAAYAEAGRFPEAVKTCQRTIGLAEAAGNSGFSAASHQLLALYQMGQPYHTPAD